MKKVAIFLPSLHGGGAERAMLNAAKGIAKHGYKVDLVLVKAEGEYLKEIDSSINLIDLKGSRVAFSLFNFIKYLKLNKPSAVFSAMNYVNLFCIVSILLSGIKTRIVISEHTTLSKVASFNNSNKKLVINFLVKKLYKYSFKVICVSDGVAKDLNTNYKIDKSKLKTIHNLVISDEMIKKSFMDLKHPWYKKDAPPIILAVGRMIPDKDFRTLILAFNEVLKTTEARLIILGEGKGRNELEKLARELELENKILMPGFVENPYYFMRNSKVFVLSSKREGFGNVILEALACDTTVVSTDCQSGPREILEDGKYGYLVEVGNYIQLSNSIIKALTEDKIVPKDVLTKYKEDKIINEYIEILFY